MNNFQESLHTGSGASQMTLVDERVMDTVGRSTANVRGLQIPDVEVSFAPSTVMPYDELFIYPQASEVRVEQNVHQDLVQAGPSGQQNSNAGMILPAPSYNGDLKISHLDSRYSDNSKTG
jgi:hypothetical protein